MGIFYLVNKSFQEKYSGLFLTTYQTIFYSFVTPTSLSVG